MPPRSPFDFNEVESPSLLLVEGIDDARFFDAFLKNGLEKYSVQIAQVRCKSNFRPFSGSTLKLADSLPNLRRLGVVRDADTSATSAFQSLRDSLIDAGFPAPTRPWRTIDSGPLSVSVAVLPDGNSTGDLEKLCLRSVANLVALFCVENYIDFMGGVGLPSPQLSKSQLHAFLAVGNNPGRRLGEAAQAGIWDWRSPAFAQLSYFLTSL